MYSVPVYKIRLLKDGNVSTERKQIRSPQDAIGVIAVMLADLDTEHLIAVMLDSNNKVIGVHTVATGGLNACHIRIADVFKAAILSNAASIILSHNHPSGDPTPSPEDIKLTQHVVKAGKLLDIDILDHIIFADNDGQRTISLKGRHPEAFDTN
jgi:DNA repair protein RadC